MEKLTKEKYQKAITSWRLSVIAVTSCLVVVGVLLSFSIYNLLK